MLKRDYFLLRQTIAYVSHSWKSQATNTWDSNPSNYFHHTVPISCEQQEAKEANI